MSLSRCCEPCCNLFEPMHGWDANMELSIGFSTEELECGIWELYGSGYVRQSRDRVYHFWREPAKFSRSCQRRRNPFGKVIKQISDCSGLDSSEKQLDFVQNPHQAPHSECSNDTRPDSFFVRRSRVSQTSVRPGSEQRDISLNILWDDIAVSGEYKKKAGDKELDDVSVVLQLLWVILTPPRRMYAKWCGACITYCAVTHAVGSLLGSLSKTPTCRYGLRATRQF